MNKYKYTARSKSNEIITGVEFAKDENELFELLQEKSLLLETARKKVRINIKRKNWHELILQKARITKKTEQEFTFGMPLLLRSGCTIIEAINIISENTRSFVLRRVLKIIRLRLENGQDLVTAFRGFPFIFPDLFLTYLSTASMSNRIQDVFENISTEKRLKRQFIFSLVVPNIPYFAFLALCIALWVIFYKTGLQEIIYGYRLLTIKIPPVIRNVIATTNFINQYIYSILMYLFIAFFTFRLLQFWNLFKRLTHYCYSKIPFIGRLIRETAIIQYTSSIILGMKIGYNVLQCARYSRNSIGNRYYRKMVQQVYRDLKNAIPLKQSFITHRFFDKIECQLIGFAEKSGDILPTISEIKTNNEQRREAGFSLLKEFIKIFVLATAFASLSLLLEVITVAIRMLLLRAGQ